MTLQGNKKCIKDLMADKYCTLSERETQDQGNEESVNVNN